MWRGGGACRGRSVLAGLEFDRRQTAAACRGRRHARRLGAGRAAGVAGRGARRRIRAGARCRAPEPASRGPRRAARARAQRPGGSHPRGAGARAGSVLAGLQGLADVVRDDVFVLVHEAARPNLHHADLGALLERGRNDPVGAILAAPVRDTLKRAGGDGGIDGTEPRERLWRALTPQLFRRLQLTRALEAARDAGVEVTDEAMAMERQGMRPLLVEGDEDNFKITTASDLARFEFLLSRRSSN